MLYINVIVFIFLSTFIDIDECELGMTDCHENSTCVDTFGSYLCICNSGFSGNGTDCLSMSSVCFDGGSVK